MTDHFDKLLSGLDKIMRDDERVADYEARLAALTAQHITAGKTPEVARDLAKTALADDAPTDAMRFNSIRAKVLKEQLAKRERGDLSLNPGLAAMAAVGRVS